MTVRLSRDSGQAFGQEVIYPGTRDQEAVDPRGLGLLPLVQVSPMLITDQEGTDVTITNTTTVYDLITPDLRASLIAMVRKDSWPEMTDDQGERGVDQMAAFLAVAVNGTERVTPSLRVDLFWHALVLHTKHYAEFCEALGGFIHHVPDRSSGHNPAEGRAAMRRTAEILRSAGFDVDPEFWPMNGAAECTQSYAGCSDSPVAK
ncbi:hypothetical protein [Streptomyces sp. NPDC005953]|uniref:glycine-rich domain-containing protein n=1 Tax=Streptomyces sp. NPDC005953 TaxID=3156719 RepID=UPI0033C8BAC7